MTKIKFKPRISLFEDFENEAFLTGQLITYIGNKRKLLNFIGGVLRLIQKDLNKDKLDILDGFSGSGVVARYFKKYSKKLYVNDLELYSEIINKCYLSNQPEIDLKILQENIDWLNSIKLKSRKKGIIAKLYSPKNDKQIEIGERVFYTNTNARIIDNIRAAIDKFPTAERHLYLAPLLSEASIHANTSGVFKGFYKNSETSKGQFGGNAKNCLQRITKEIELPVPILSDFNCECQIFKKDTNQLVKEISEIDVAYFDPPYNQHPYGSNYFMLNVIADNKKPKEISNVSGIPKNWNKSSYNSKKSIHECFENLIAATNSKYIVVSYSSEGFLNKKEVEQLLKKYGSFKIVEKNYNAFRGSRNLHNRNKSVKEYLFVLKK